ncbi:hypothetical protein COCCADRAFT_85581 [Bipolaris zeicola 26-R-13]|uniref:Uncharacterized protein n=1 Tax=Cochliobolus carbonum (strain 26-R-13) TaxID=930089 RepID=W6Z1C0_COCC2|nr:uncharacterized protein COCCADRAFT_85581 [Bipolaris zeicola 26-R-13]EUC37476.1 hypothetical protein COCCADRAFT_85581 [Bipolaris zeicola 26-R-13]
MFCWWTQVSVHSQSEHISFVSAGNADSNTNSASGDSCRMAAWIAFLCSRYLGKTRTSTQRPSS